MQYLAPQHPPFQWYGGKWEIADWIIEHLPPHHTYVEPFGGAASVLLRKEPSPVEVYNDLDDLISNFFAICRDCRDELIYAVSMTPYHRGDYKKALRIMTEQEPDLIEKARLFILIARQSMSGAFGRSWSHVKVHSRRGMASGNSRWLNVAASIYQIADRLQEVQIECRPALKIIEEYDTPETLFYCDPPYHPGTCQNGVYRHGMTAEEHDQFLAHVLAAKGKFVISGYDHPSYNQALAGWKKVAREVPCRSNVNANGKLGKRPTRQEVLWIKP